MVLEPSESGTQNSATIIRHYAVAAVLLLVVLVVYFPALSNQFVNLDDPAYVVFNEHIAKLNVSTLLWAFTSFYEGNWHPLTMLSLAFDRFLWGLDPAGYILTNTVIHGIATVCVFSCVIELLRLHSSQGTPTCKWSDSSLTLGASVGTLFWALHPLRVESVVWVSERKDVLCTLFMVLTVWAYLRHGRKQTSITAGQGLAAYPSAALCFAVLASLSKPTAVSIPAVLCILDWYPLRRWTGFAGVKECVRQKLPFIALSLFTAIMTLMAQQVSMQPLQVIDPLSRLLVASKALFFYLYKSIWPAGLAAFYPHPGNVASTAAAYYLPFVFALVVAAAVLMRTLRMTRVWCALAAFYVITVTPMIGLVQVGGQWAADRYSYFPSLAFAMVVAGLVTRIDAATAVRGVLSRRVAVMLCCLPLGALAGATIIQIGYWHSTETLATRIIDLQPHKAGSVYLARAIHRNSNGRYQEALKDAGEAMNLALKIGRVRSAGEAAIAQAESYAHLGRYQEALTILEWGIRTYSPKPGEKAYALLDELRAKRGQVTDNQPRVFDQSIREKQ